MRACEVHTPEGQDVLDFAFLILPRWLPKPFPWKFPKASEKGQTKWNQKSDMKKRLKKVLGTEWQPKSYVWAVNNAELSKRKRQKAQHERVSILAKSIQQTLRKTKHSKADARKAMVPSFSIQKFTDCFLCIFLYLL